MFCRVLQAMGGVGKAAQEGVAEIRSLKHETRVEQHRSIEIKSADIKQNMQNHLNLREYYFCHEYVSDYYIEHILTFVIYLKPTLGTPLLLL